MRPARAAGSACRRHGTCGVRAYRSAPTRAARAGDDPWMCLNGLRGDRDGLLEMLVRRAVVATGKRRPLARLALPGGRVAPCDASVEQPGLDLLLDERRRRADALTHRPGDARLCRDGEVAPNVREERAVRASEVVRVEE